MMGSKVQTREQIVTGREGRGGVPYPYSHLHHLESPLDLLSRLPHERVVPNLLDHT